MTCEKLGRADLLRCATYLDAKQSAKEFQDAKRLMVTKFKGSGYGMWVSKPIEEKMFSQTVKADWLTEDVSVDCKGRLVNRRCFRKL